MSVLNRLSAIVESAFEALNYPAQFAHVVLSARPDLAPFQCNAAMAVAGYFKKQGEKVNPREIATKIVAHLEDADEISAMEIAGPGFINIHPSVALVTETAARLKSDTTVGIEAVTPQTVMVDYGGANVAKPMHVGHLRSAVLGEAIKRLFRVQGHKVIGDVHLGDWGLQMGHLISELEHEQPKLPYFDADFDGDYPKQSPVTMDDLARLYPQASNKAKTDADRLELSRVATAELQAGRRGYRALLEHFIAESIKALKKGYGSLNVDFDLWKGEAAVDPLIPDMIDTLVADGIAEKSDGALIVNVAEETDKKEMPPVILKASSGAVLYHTTDLATLLDRKAEYNPDLILYVVDQRQALHFEQVFRAAVKAGWYAPEAMEHIGFGTMNGKDGKPFKTRDGGVLRLDDLIGMAEDAAKARLDEAGIGKDFDATEQADIAHKVAVAALKFADLQNQPLTNYVFDLERFTAFEGKTGPYLLYAAVRIKSLLRKAKDQGLSAGDITPSEPAESALVLALDSFGRAVKLAAEKRSPHILCEHIFSLAQSFSRFYTDCPVLQDQVPVEVKASRLALAETTLRQLELGLDILAIDVPERM
ncbi:MAG: arginine--tRNA ligase [Maricaulaceae bacterium]